MKRNGVVVKVTRPRPFLPSAVRCRTLSTVNCTTTVPSTRLKATTSDVITGTDSGSRASNRTVCSLSPLVLGLSGI